jgi:hypothetical protein
MKIIRKALIMIIAVIVITACLFFLKQIRQNRMLKQVIARLKADSRVAEVLVTGVKKDESGRELTTIKFLEYDAAGKPLPPKYFTFRGNLIQFQSLVIRFDDFYVEKGDPLKGKSAYLFMKAFVLAGPQTQEFEITQVNSIPDGYKIEGLTDSFEGRLWKRFWRYALDKKEADRLGIKNAQIEAPGSRFMPGTIYTIKIEHDGGMRIDTVPVPQILRGEKIE